MDANEFFASRWPEVVPGLRAALARAGAPVADREDLVQETALRLYGMWDRVDWDQPVEALARRIALNALRDQWRRRGDREVFGELPEQASPADTEKAAVARLEVAEVSRALNSLPVQTARVLRVAAAESEDPDSAPASAALRMARTRARRALVACLKVASAVVAAMGLGGRRLSASVKYSTATATAMGAVALVILLDQHAGSGGRVPGFTTSPGPAPLGVSAEQRLTATSGVNANGSAGSAARSARHHLRGQQNVPWFKVQAGPAEVHAFADVNVAGDGVRVSRPQPREPLPVCTYGATPTLLPVRSC